MWGALATLLPNLSSVALHPPPLPHPWLSHDTSGSRLRVSCSALTPKSFPTWPSEGAQEHLNQTLSGGSEGSSEPFLAPERESKVS